MEEFSKNGLKLRPRKTSAASSAGKEEKRDFHRRGNDSRNGEHRFSGNRTTGRRFGEHRTDGQASGERRPAEHRTGEHRTGERQFGERQFGERRSAGNRTGEHRFPGHRDGEHRFSDRKPQDRRFGNRRPFDGRRNGEAQFSKESDEGIDRMIRRKSRIETDFAARKPQIQEEIQEEIRLNRFIANSGVCSRREADTYIQAGVVTVNGEVVTELGTKVNVLKDDVRFNGQRLKGEEKVYIVMNKPKGFVTTASDPHADHTVMELLSNCESRVFPVGRLDKNTTGVLMFTNDGEISERLTHPSFDKKKIYQVILDRALEQEDFDCILNGISLNDGEIKADEL
ncbi:MAG: pseudouridine synthase, partial [Bacteroidales bacterium]|nr:pseudouridine synthase [Bacteroidales bacterium]